MKNLKYIVSGLTAVLFFYACDQGIDGLTEVDPGPDISAPQVNITAPADGVAVKVNEELATITVAFEAQDDIELASVEVLLDGTNLRTYTDFKDYRRLIVNDLVYDKLADGNHVLTVTATDIEGKATSEVVNFTKEPAYIAKYPGEILYMPFDGDYVDLISFETAEQIGSPAISEETVAGSGAYAGATESYLTLDSERFKNAAFSAIFWIKLNAMPDRAGILAMSPPLDDAGGNVLTSGFRFFREAAAGNQRFKLNVGSGDTGNWFDGGEAADVDPASEEWVNMAFTISGTEAIVYIDGQVVSQGPLAGVDWTDCNVLSIMSGAPNFSAWDHLSDLSLMDELRIFDRAITQEDIIQIIQDDSGIVVSDYPPTFDGEIFYMPFDGDYQERFRETEATVVGTPAFAGESAAGEDAYAGAADSYLTLPVNGLTTDELSATMWYKLNADPDRAGILTISPQDPDNADFPETQNNRNSGFRLLREAGPGGQVFKLNVGTGDGEAWADGGEAASLDPATDTDWVQLAFTISEESIKVYIDGELVAETAMSGIDWTGTEILSIGSGAPRFTGFNHLSDASLIDELRFYDKALTQEEIQNIRDSGL